MNLISRVMEITSIDKTGKIDRIVGIKLIITLFENLKGKIDNLFSNIFNGLLNELNLTKSNKLKSIYFQSLLMAIYYSPELSFGLLEQNKITDQFFNALINFEQHIKYAFECRRILIGLCSGIQSQSFPNKLVPLLFPILKFAIKICFKDIKNELEDMESSSNDEEIKDEDKYMETLNIINDMQKENAAKEMKNNVNNSQEKTNNLQPRKQNDKMEEEDEDDDDDDDDDEGKFFELGKYKIEAADMKLYKSQLEETDEVLLFRDLIFLIKNKSPEIFENFKNSLSKNESDDLALCVAKANEYEAERNEATTN